MEVVEESIFLQTVASERKNQRVMFPCLFLFCFCHNLDNK